MWSKKEIVVVTVVAIICFAFLTYGLIYAINNPEQPDYLSFDMYISNETNDTITITLDNCTGSYMEGKQWYVCQIINSNGIEIYNTHMIYILPKTEGNVTFSDNDHDGNLSDGDTYHIKKSLINTGSQFKIYHQYSEFDGEPSGTIKFN